MLFTDIGKEERTWKRCEESHDTGHRGHKCYNKKGRVFETLDPMPST